MTPVLLQSNLDNGPSCGSSDCNKRKSDQISGCDGSSSSTLPTDMTCPTALEAARTTHPTRTIVHPVALIIVASALLALPSRINNLGYLARTLCTLHIIWLPLLLHLQINLSLHTPSLSYPPTSCSWIDSQTTEYHSSASHGTLPSSSPHLLHTVEPIALSRNIEVISATVSIVSITGANSAMNLVVKSSHVIVSTTSSPTAHPTSSQQSRDQSFK